MYVAIVKKTDLAHSEEPEIEEFHDIETVTTGENDAGEEVIWIDAFDGTKTEFSSAQYNIQITG